MNSNQASDKAGLKTFDLEMLSQVANDAAIRGGSVLMRYFGNINMIKNILKNHWWLKC